MRHLDEVDGEAPAGDGEAGRSLQGERVVRPVVEALHVVEQVEVRGRRGDRRFEHLRVPLTANDVRVRPVQSGEHLERRAECAPRVFRSAGVGEDGGGGKGAREARRCFAGAQAVEPPVGHQEYVDPEQPGATPTERPSTPPPTIVAPLPCVRTGSMGTDHRMSPGPANAHPPQTVGSKR